MIRAFANTFAMALGIICNIFLLLSVLMKAIKGTEHYFEMRKVFLDDMILDNESVSLSFSRIHCATLCTLDNKCTSFYYHHEDKGCIQRGRMLDHKCSGKWQNQWEYFVSSKIACSFSYFS